MKILKTVFLVHFILLSGLSVTAQYITERPDWSGVWFNTWDAIPDFSQYGDIVTGEAGRLQWGKMEPEKGVYDFSELKTKLQRAKENDYYFYFELWTGSHTPSWIYENGVPEVITNLDRDLGREGTSTYPYYLDEDYKKYITEFFEKLAATIANYPPDLIKRLAFIQPGFGSTGDRQLYKGTPNNPQYSISKVEYVDFMKEMTIAITNAFRRHATTSDIRFLWNIDDYDGSNPDDLNSKSELVQGEMLYGKWMKENYNAQLRKQQFTIAIGYMPPNEMNQDREQRDHFFGTSGRWGGNPEFIRGEFNDYRWGETPLAKLNKPLHYYWTAISSVDKGLDGWEFQYSHIHPDLKEAYVFSHRYSYYKEAETSPVAFIALRDVLDYSDTERFPESTYGEASRDNQQRIDNILSKYNSYGARNDDNNAIITLHPSSYLLNVEGYNDVVWNVIARNYRRFITQIEPNETSAGYWRVGDGEAIYSRFARGFDVEENKNAMYFDVDDQFFSENRKNGNGWLKVRIIYYANDGGSWELKYHANDGTMKTACAVTNESGKNWLTKEVILEDALLNNGGPKGADLIIQNTGNTNIRFHLVELEKKLIP